MEFCVYKSYKFVVFNRRFNFVVKWCLYEYVIIIVFDIDIVVIYWKGGVFFVIKNMCFVYIYFFWRMNFININFINDDLF